MTRLRVAVVDYESGNLRSVARALVKAGAEPVVTGDPRVLMECPAAVLPGVGAGDSAMRSLDRRGLAGPIQEYVGSGRPFLGVCLGLQLLMDRTEEGMAPCLGLVPGVTRRLPDGLKVPHMGWNQVSMKTTHPVLEGVPDNADFYFVHSYYADPADEGVVAAVTEYGPTFCSIIARDNLIATQFHPEKSGALGLRLYQGFVRYVQGQRR